MNKTHRGVSGYFQDYSTKICCRKIIWQVLPPLLTAWSPHKVYYKIEECCSGMLRRVTPVRTDVTEERSASIIRVTKLGELGTTLPRNSS
jgi:hypothetical protein